MKVIFVLAFTTKVSKGLTTSAGQEMYGLLIAHDIDGFHSDVSPNHCDMSCCYSKQCILPHTGPWGG